MEEKDLIFKKSFKCPICDTAFKNLTVRQGKARPDSTDIDLKVNYKNIEVLKYDVIMCPVCGYAALERYFERVSAYQRKCIIDEISVNFQAVPDKDDYTYDEVIVRYRQAINVSRVKNAHNSELGFLCLKFGWIYRAYAASLNPETEAKKIKELSLREQGFLNNAFLYLEKARATESSPICGMDESTLDCLLAGLAVKLGKYVDAKKYVGFVIQNRSATKRAKDKVIDIKEIVNEKLAELEGEEDNDEN